MSGLAKFAFAMVALLFVTPALADDWVAVKLRGTVVQLVDNTWQPLHRKDVVPDSRVVRTVGNGYVEFTRGGETIELQPNTQIQIFDKGAAKPDTTVKQYFGTVAIEAQVEDVQHFAVDTPFLAAVVKGTRFVVISDKRGASVKVNRGHVLVADKHDQSRVLIGVGQTATVGAGKSDGGIVVGGHGKLPTVVDSKGQPVETTASSSSSGVNVGVGGVKVGVGGKRLVSVGVGDDDDGAGLVDVSVGGSKGAVNLSVGGNSPGGSLLGVSIGPGGGNSGQGSSGGGSGSSGSSGSSSGSGSSGSSGGGGSGSGSGGGSGGNLVNVNIGGIHIGL